MKLNIDCIRDILLYVEEFSDGETFVIIDKDKLSSNDLLSQYDFQTIKYHVKQSEMSNLICGSGTNPLGIIYIKDLTPTGHGFLENIRDSQNYSKIKEIFNKAKSFSLPIFIHIAQEYIYNKISNF